MPPDVILTEAERESALTTPSDALIRQMKGMAGTLMIVGAGGKMGPTLAVLAARAVAASGSKLKIIAVSRFSDPSQKEWLQARNISTISADLLDDGDVKELPDADFVVSLAGKKFGTSVDPSETWAVNCLASASVCKGFRGSSIVALSTGNVYPVVALDSGGSNEDDTLIATGEYSAAAIGRKCHQICGDAERRGRRHFRDRSTRRSKSADYRIGHGTGLAAGTARSQPFHRRWHGEHPRATFTSLWR